MCTSDEGILIIITVVFNKEQRKFSKILRELNWLNKQVDEIGLQDKLGKQKFH